MFLILVAARAVSTPIDSKASASAAVYIGSMPAILPTDPVFPTTCAISSADVAVFAARKLIWSNKSMICSWLMFRATSHFAAQSPA